MRTFSRLLIVLALASTIAGCVPPSTSPSPVDSVPGGPATQLPTFRLPGESFKPGLPDPTIEIPPPIY